MLFAALLLWPFVTIPNRRTLVLGVPALVLYFFVVWGAIVLVLAWASRRSRGEDAP